MHVEYLHQPQKPTRKLIEYMRGILNVNVLHIKSPSLQLT